jgi:hypothetical protein
MRYLQQWKQDGNWRVRFRRPGHKPVELPTPHGYRGDKATLGDSKAFLTAYLAAMAEPVAEVAPGEKRAAWHGGVAVRGISRLARLPRATGVDAREDQEIRPVQEPRAQADHR